MIVSIVIVIVVIIITVFAVGHKLSQIVAATSVPYSLLVPLVEHSDKLRHVYNQATEWMMATTMLAASFLRWLASLPSWCQIQSMSAEPQCRHQWRTCSLLAKHTPVENVNVSDKTALSYVNDCE